MTQNIEALLENCGFAYELIRHAQAILTVQQGVEHFGIQPGQTAPALALATERGLVMLILSGRLERVDFAALSEQVGFAIAGLAPRSEVKRATGFRTGALALVGHGLPCIIDTTLLQYDFVYGGTGDERCTLKIDPRALLALNRVIARVTLK